MYDLIIIGAGPAGLASAVEAYNQGLEKVLLIERDKELGGILNQCIHNGFGLQQFKQELTGPEFAGKFIDKLKQTNVEVLLDTMVLDFDENHNVHILNSNGYKCLQAKAIILAMGCRERTRGAIATPGSRAAGVFTAGTAQRYMNMDGYCVGKKVVILGSGDIGLIMARRMTLEGAKVLACIEINPFSSGLQRNIKQCLEDFDIPLYLSHTITNIRGDSRVTGVTVMEVDERFNPIEDTEISFDCDTVLLSVGLIPENELSKSAGVEMDIRTKAPIVYENNETSIDGVFCCGNVLQVHDLADNVTYEAAKTAKAASKYVLNNTKLSGNLEIKVSKGISYSVPQRIHTNLLDKTVEVNFRVNKVYGKSKIFVRNSKDEVICQYSREFIVPGELQKIIIPVSLMKNENNYLSISVEEG